MDSTPASANRSLDGIYSSPYGQLEDVEPSSLFEYLWGEKCEIHGKEGSEEKVAMLDYSSGKEYTRKEAKELIIRMAATLLEKYNLQKGDHVLIAFPTNSFFVILCSACIRAGLIMALTNPAYTPEEFQHAYELTQAKLVLTTASLKENFRKAQVKETILIDVMTEEQEGGEFYSNLIESKQKSETILEKAGANQIDWNSACGIFFSSGTTGLPKAVLISHKNLISLRLALCKIPNYKASYANGQPSNTVIFLPAFHIAGLAGIILALSLGNKICFALSNPINLKMIVKAIFEFKPKRQVMVPPLLLAFTRLPLTGPEGFKGIYDFIYSAAAPLGKSLKEEAENRLKVNVGQFWGMSETTGAVTASNPTKKSPGGSCGQLVAGMEMKFVDEEDKIVQHGQPGEILVRGPLTMMRYHDNQKATQETLTKDGWLRTGDIGFMDDESILYIVDRRKELIKYKGMQIAPAELEAILLSHPAVMDVGVIGIVPEDTSIGEIPRAFIVLRTDKGKDQPENKVYDPKSESACEPNQGILAHDIQNFLASKVSGYKKLRGGVVYLDQIPKNPSGKILRRFLRDMSKSRVKLNV